MQKIGLDSDLLVKNDYPASIIPRYRSKVSQDEFEIQLDSVEGHNAVVQINAADMLAIIQQDKFATISSVDNLQTNLPTAGQRTPTTDRFNNINTGWQDGQRVPDSKIEVIRAAVYGGKIRKKDDKFILTGKNAILVLVDGGGRVGTAEWLLDKNADIRQHILVGRDIRFMLNLDLTADRVRSLKEFLLYNRDIKHVSNGTNMVVENGLLDLTDYQIESVTSKLFPAFIAKQIYSKPIQGSLIEAMPWKFEGESAKNKEFLPHGGNASSLQTAVRDAVKFGPIRSLHLTVDEWSEMVDFALREWYKMCPRARASLSSGKQGKTRIVSTLGLKIIVTISAMVWKTTGSESREFQSLCEKVINKHFHFFKEGEGKSKGYLNPKRKKMDCDTFWFENALLSGPEFNSGAANTQYVVKNLLRIAADVTGIKEEKDGSEKKETVSVN